MADKWAVAGGGARKASDSNTGNMSNGMRMERKASLKSLPNRCLRLRMNNAASRQPRRFLPTSCLVNPVMYLFYQKIALQITTGHGGASGAKNAPETGL